MVAYSPFSSHHHQQEGCIRTTSVTRTTSTSFDLRSSRVSDHPIINYIMGGLICFFQFLPISGSTVWDIHNSQ
jgi:hypothetical protein